MVKPKVRKSIYMSEEIANYFVDEANNLGVSESAMMTMALKHYIDYQKSLDFSGQIQSLIQLVEKGEMPKNE